MHRHASLGRRSFLGTLGSAALLLPLARPGRAEARGVLAESVDGRIHFAGEHLAGPLMQTCGGARLSGEAVARNVVHDLVGNVSG